MGFKKLFSGKSQLPRKKEESGIDKSSQNLPQSAEELLSGLKTIKAFDGSRTGQMDVVFCFDTTGSMYPYFERVKDSIIRIVREVKNKTSQTRFGLIAYKNHGDEEDFFKGKPPFWIFPLTANESQIKQFMERVKKGGGGPDALTALEDVLHYLNISMGWNRQSVKVVVLIGDMPPHGVLDRIEVCPYGYNYRQETETLTAQGIKVYSVFCYEEIELTSIRKQKVRVFFQEIARLTSGRYLELVEIEDIIDLLIAICMKETGQIKTFIAEMESRGQLTPSKQRLMLELKGDE